MRVRAAVDGVTIVLCGLLAVIFIRNHWPKSPIRMGTAPLGVEVPRRPQERTPSGRILDRGLLYDVRAAASHVSSPDAGVRIVVFEDFSCSWCGKFDSTMRALEGRFPDAVSVAYRELLLDSMASNVRDTHVAARCAVQQGTFDSFHRAAFANQSLVRSSGGWRKIARIAGIPNAPAFEACVEHQTYLPEVLSSSRSAVALGYRSTPVIIVGERQFIGAVGLPELTSAVESTIVQLRRQ